LVKVKGDLDKTKMAHILKRMEHYPTSSFSVENSRKKAKIFRLAFTTTVVENTSSLALQSIIDGHYHILVKKNRALTYLEA
jgi:hypothetical protein